MQIEINILHALSQGFKKFRTFRKLGNSASEKLFLLTSKLIIVVLLLKTFTISLQIKSKLKFDTKWSRHPYFQRNLMKKKSSCFLNHFYISRTSKWLSSLK